MKLIIILFGFGAFVSALQQEKFKIPPEKLARLYEIGKNCAIEHNVDVALFPKLADGTLPRDEASSKFSHCFGVKSKLTDEEGHINVDAVATLVGNHPRVEEFKQALTKCNDFTKENPVETVKQMNICYAETSPIILVFE